MLTTTIKENDVSGSKVIGMRIVAEDSEEQKILRRFWDGGMKMNSFSASGEEIGVTFEDSIK